MSAHHLEREAEVIAAVRALTPYDARVEEGWARARTQECRATYVALPSGDFIEIHDDLDGSYAAFITTQGNAPIPISELAAREILHILHEAQFPVDS